MPFPFVFTESFYILIRKWWGNRWAPNLETLSWLLVDRVFIGAFAEPGGPLKVLEFLLAMLQLANSDGRVEDATPAGKGLRISLVRGATRQVEAYVQVLLKNTNRMLMFCFLAPADMRGLLADNAFSSFRRSSDSFNQSTDSMELGSSGDVGLPLQELDKGTVLQLVLANRKLIFCASNIDSELLCAFCVNVTPMVWDSEPTVRSLAVEVWKVLVLHRSPTLEDVLVQKGTQVRFCVHIFSAHPSTLNRNP